MQTAMQEVAEYLGAPPVKEGQVEALAFAQTVAADPKLRFDATLRPGGPLLPLRMQFHVALECNPAMEAHLPVWRERQGSTPWITPSFKPTREWSHLLVHRGHPS